MCWNERRNLTEERMSVDTDGSRSEDSVMLYSACLPLRTVASSSQGLIRILLLMGTLTVLWTSPEEHVKLLLVKIKLILHPLLIQLLKIILSKSSQIFAQSPFFLMGPRSDMSHSPRGAVNALPRTDTLTLKWHNKPWQHLWPNGTWIGWLCLWETWGH